ncbi:restriction endonuclease [Saccharopolyspora rosea]|uniref:restriction endonuclease n=1 Tax=Saccharopolyspora rosea TaxID=524884 RepID=UPI0021DA553F|nr:restriction endonuclease [Saccharopolyspora rosea]
MRQQAAREARERASQRKEEERRRKADERKREETRVHQQYESAKRQTDVVAQRVTELTGILSAALSKPVGPLDFEALKNKPSVPTLDLGSDARPTAPPRWEQFAPEPPSVASRMFGGRARYEREKAIAEKSFEAALERHREDETRRQRRVVEARKKHAEQAQVARKRVAAQHQSIDDLRRKVHEKDRRAVSKYFQLILDRIEDPSGLPKKRRAAYVPESELLVIEWELPSTAVIPTEKEFAYIKSRDVIEVRKNRPSAEIRKIYNDMAAQIALRTLHTIFHADPASLVSTIVFNGVVEAIDPVTGHEIRPELITLRATREQFEQVKLQGVKPVECVQKFFGAEVSEHPDELVAVAPILSFDMADPRIVDPIDVISDIDKRPNLLELSSKEFESFVQNLFARMGFDTKQFKASGDGGIDCIAYDPTPITGGKFVIQVKLYTRTVPPTHVRDLYGVVLDEGATKGILITTDGFGPGSYNFANNKPLQLIDGTGLLHLCQQHNIPARILKPRRKK